MEITTIIFDWGDTLMVNFPQYSGPMADWPEVQAMPGAEKILASLAPNYRLVLASNAAESDAGLVKKALTRVNLDGYFQDIFTFHELGARKPDAGFFRAIEKRLNLSSRQCVMVGDSYADDITGALAAGWQGIWFNAAAQPCAGLMPRHEAEIYQLNDLTQIMRQDFLPDWGTCNAWVMRHSPSLRLWLHVQLVAGIAYTLALRLRQQGIINVSPLLAQRGGLLHDIAKLKTLHQTHTKNHGEMGYEILNDYGQPELAEISRRHILNAILEPERRPRTWEEKLVFYADKLAEGAHPVSLDERVAALKKRYGQWAQSIEESVPALYALQCELAQALALSTEDILPYLQTAFNGQNR